jgi:hypothetical protein
VGVDVVAHIERGAWRVGVQHADSDHDRVSTVSPAICARHTRAP